MITLALLLLSGETSIPHDTIPTEHIGLERYACRDFIYDASHPKSTAQLMKPMLVISWATGYAAAHQKSDLRSDYESMKIMSRIVGRACAANPEKIAVNATAELIDSFVKK